MTGMCFILYSHIVGMTRNQSGLDNRTKIHEKSNDVQCLGVGFSDLHFVLNAACLERLCALQRALQRRVHPGLQRLELSGSNSVAINPCTVGRVQTLQQLRLFRVFGANALHLRCMTARQDGLRACWGRRLVMLCPTVWFQSVPVAMPVTNLVDGEAIHGCDF